MNAYKRLAVAVLALPLMLGSVSALASADHNPPCSGNMHVKYMLRGLELTPDQEKKLSKIREDHRDERMKDKDHHMGERAANHEKMQNFLMADKYNKEGVRALSEKMSKEHVEHHVKRLQKHRDVIDILTSDQKVELKTNLQNGTACKQRMNNHNRHGK